MAAIATSIEDLVGRVGAIPNQQSRETAEALVSAILELHGSGLERILELLQEAGEAGEVLIGRIAGDHLAGGLLTLHGLHPDSLETRVGKALTRLAAEVESVSVADGVVRVRLKPGGRGRREKVEAALREAAPDAAEITVGENNLADSFVPLASVGMARGRSV